MKLAQATCVSQVILLTFAEACHDIEHSPVRGTTPAPASLGRPNLCSRALQPSGDLSPEPKGRGRVVPAFTGRASLQGTGAW